MQDRSTIKRALFAPHRNQEAPRDITPHHSKPHCTSALHHDSRGPVIPHHTTTAPQHTALHWAMQSTTRRPLLLRPPSAACPLLLSPIPPPLQPPPPPSHPPPPTLRACFARVSWLIAMTSLAVRICSVALVMWRGSLPRMSGADSMHQNAKWLRCSVWVRPPTLPHLWPAHTRPRGSGVWMRGQGFRL